MNQKTKMVALGFLSVLISWNAIGQNLEFKLIEAIKTKELVIDRTTESELLVETDILPDNKRYLVITAEVNYPGEGRFRVKKEEVTIGSEKTEAVGYLRLSRRGNLRWGHRGSIWSGQNYFSAVFIVDASLSNTRLHIKDQSFDIPKVTESTLPVGCSPKATITKKEYLDEISFEKKYRRYGNQVFTKKITPKRGKLLRLSMAVEFCENPALFKKRAYHFELSFFQLQGADGALYECVGSFRFGKFYRPITHNIFNKDQLKQEMALVFNVPKAGKYTLVYLGKKIATF